MRVSLNWVKKYVDLPKDLTPEQIAYDLTVRTVEVEDVEDTSKKYHDIVVGKILEVKPHYNANTLRVCMVDIGEEKPVQIVCGGSNLYEGEMVVISKPGSEVIWHGEGEPVVIKETKMRGVSSYGMICGSTEVFLEEFFPLKDESQIVDLEGLDCYPGQNIADVVDMNDIVLEIDNKSLTNRPDLWGHYGIAREIAAIYKAELKPLEELKIDDNLPEYRVEIKEPEKCQRCTATEIENVCHKESPIWMKSALVNAGMRPISAIVDITNYVMLATGQPLHAYDKNHVIGDKLIVRNANEGEKLVLLDDKELNLTSDDLVICNGKEPMGLAGIMGGKNDSILPETTSILVEIANFTAPGIRKTTKRFDVRTDASMRYEKNIDTKRVEEALAMTLSLIKEIFPESKIVAHADNYPAMTKQEEIDVPQEFLDKRLGKILSQEVVCDTLESLGYKVEYNDGIYHVIVPVWRSTGDVSIKDDVMGDIARLLSYESFEATPLVVKYDHAVFQSNVLLERRLKEYLAYRCGFNEIFTYPWIDEKYVDTMNMDKTNMVKLATPPAPELGILRNSLVPGIIDSVSKNLRYFDSFKLFEMAQVFEKGEYHQSSEEETLPIHNKHLTGCIVGKNGKDIFFEIKGAIEQMAEYCHMENLNFEQVEKPIWSDKEVYLNILFSNVVVGSIGLLSAPIMNEVKIKRTNVAIFELNVDKLVPLVSRTNKFNHLPQFPLVEKDFSILIDEKVEWQEIYNAINQMVKELEFIGEYRGSQIPEGKKSYTFRFKIGNKDSTMTNVQITNKMEAILKILNRKCGAELRTE